MYLSLPVPTNKIQKISLQHCLDAFFKEEVMEKSDAWYVRLAEYPKRLLTNTSSAQELSPLQGPAQGHEAALVVASPAGPPRPSQTVLVQGPLYRQDREERRLPAQGFGSDELHATTPPAGRRSQSVPVDERGRSAAPSSSIPIRPLCRH